MRLWPTSRKAKRRLTLVLAAAPIVAIAAALAIRGMGDAVVFFYTPSQLTAATAASGRAIKLGGLVERGSVVRRPDGAVEFRVSDGRAWRRVVHQGDLPDLFREGQGVVAEGRFRADGAFLADTILAKHDERYVPRELQRELQRRGEWRGAPVT